MRKPVLVSESVARTYGSGRAAVQAVRGIDVALRPGDRLIVMGPSGSGKTTLLSMMGGLLAPNSGRILVGGEDLYRMTDSARAQVRLDRVGFIFQNFNLLSALSARENVEIPLLLAGFSKSAARLRAERLLSELGLGSRLRHRPRDLSGGEKQRVGIARALANDPDIILADEPTANLDSASGQQVARILRKLSSRGRKALMIVSHDERLLQIATQVVWLEDGVLIERRPAHLEASPGVAVMNTKLRGRGRPQYAPLPDGSGDQGRPVSEAIRLNGSQPHASRERRQLWDVDGPEVAMTPK